MINKSARCGHRGRRGLWNSWKEQLSAALLEGVQVHQTFRQAQILDIAIRNAECRSLLLGVVIVAADSWCCF